MKKKITLIASILLIIALAVTFVGCNKDKTEETPTTEASEKVSTTEPTTFEAPEIEEDETTEPTTEEQTTKEVETTKKTVSTNSGSSSSGSSSGSSNSGSSSSKPVSTTKASSNDILSNATDNGNGTYTVTLANGGTIQIGTGKKGGHSDDSEGMDWDEDGDIDADDKEFEENISWELE